MTANVTQVACGPRTVPASMGETVPGSRKAAMKPTNRSTMINGSGVVSAMRAIDDEPAASRKVGAPEVDVIGRTADGPRQQPIRSGNRRMGLDAN